jgi:hypothetical protein
LHAARRAAVMADLCKEPPPVARPPPPPTAAAGDASDGEDLEAETQVRRRRRGGVGREALYRTDRLRGMGRGRKGSGNGMQKGRDGGEGGGGGGRRLGRRGFIGLVGRDPGPRTQARSSRILGLLCPWSDTVPVV